MIAALMQRCAVLVDKGWNIVFIYCSWVGWGLPLPSAKCHRRVCGGTEEGNYFLNRIRFTGRVGMIAKLVFQSVDFFLVPKFSFRYRTEE